MKVNLGQLVLQIAALFIAFAAALFLAAGTIRWAAGWAFLALFFAFTVAISAWLARTNPGLLTERMTGIGRPDQKAWDKALYVVLNVIFFAWLAIMPLDAVRFGWSHMPGWLQVVGAVVLIASFYLFYLTYRENAFLSPAVRVQTDREQTVVTRGPYGVVRHPMYATAVILFIGTSLLLGSWIGLAWALPMTAAIAFRAVQEERVLRDELPGYAEYQGQVRYRLIPFVW